MTLPIPRWTAALQTDLKKAGVPLKLMPGGEMNLYAGVEKTPEEDIVPLALGKYMLVDMWAETIPDFFEPAIQVFSAGGRYCLLRVFRNGRAGSPWGKTPAAAFLNPGVL